MEIHGKGEKEKKMLMPDLDEKEKKVMKIRQRSFLSFFHSLCH